MAEITVGHSGSKASAVKKIAALSKDKSKELVTVEVAGGRIEAAKAYRIDETEVCIYVVYKGLANKLSKKHYYDVKIIGNGTLAVGADGEGNSRVNFRG
ncbi:MAG: hypothetical protein K9G33_07370 [Sneathiella sp.]|nr:hypothetical protein [Sneathiella sp.]